MKNAKPRVPPLAKSQVPPVVNTQSTSSSDVLVEQQIVGQLNDVVDESDVHKADAQPDAVLLIPPLVHETGQGGSPGAPRLTDARSVIPAKNPTSHLSTRQAKDLAYIAHVDGKIRKKATAILDMSLSGADIDDPTEAQPVVPKPDGWTEKRFRVAKDARKPLKHQPGYLSAAQRMVESYKRAEAAIPVAPVLNAEVIQVHIDARTYNYEVKDVGDGD